MIKKEPNRNSEAEKSMTYIKKKKNPKRRSIADLSRQKNQQTGR